MLRLARDDCVAANMEPLSPRRSTRRLASTALRDGAGILWPHPPALATDRVHGSSIAQNKIRLYTCRSVTVITTSGARELDLAHAHPWTSCLLTANAVSSGGFVNPSALERTVDETWSNPRHCTADCDASRIRTRALEILSRRPRTRSHTSEQREWLHDRSDRTCNPELFNLRETRQTVPRRSLGSV